MTPKTNRLISSTIRNAKKDCLDVFHKALQSILTAIHVTALRGFGVCFELETSPCQPLSFSYCYVASKEKGISGTKHGGTFNPVASFLSGYLPYNLTRLKTRADVLVYVKYILCGRILQAKQWTMKTWNMFGKSQKRSGLQYDSRQFIEGTKRTILTPFVDSTKLTYPFRLNTFS